MRKKNIKYTAIVTVYIYTVIVANMHIYTFIDWLMWVDFGQKYVNHIFFYYTHTDVNALRWSIDISLNTKSISIIA